MVVPLGKLNLMPHVLEIPPCLSDGNTKYSRPCVNSDFFPLLFLLVLPRSWYLLHTHTQICTLPKSQGATLEYQDSLHNYLSPVLYYEDFSISHNL